MKNTIIKRRRISFSQSDHLEVDATFIIEKKGMSEVVNGHFACTKEGEVIHLPRDKNKREELLELFEIDGLMKTVKKTAKSIPIIEDHLLKENLSIDGGKLEEEKSSYRDYEYSFRIKEVNLAFRIQLRPYQKKGEILLLLMNTYIIDEQNTILIYHNMLRDLSNQVVHYLANESKYRLKLLFDPHFDFYRKGVEHEISSRD